MSRLALLLPDLEAGGAQRVMLILAQKFVSYGHEVDLVVLRGSGPLQSEVPPNVNLVDLQAATHRLGRLGFSVSSIRRLAVWMKVRRPDSMLSTITGANLAAVIARKLANTPVRLLVRHAASLQCGDSALRLSMMKFAYRQADAVIALNSTMAERIINQLDVPARQVFCIANPVDAEQIRVSGQEPIKHPWFERDLPPVIISVGRLVPEKDYVTLLRAFAILREKTTAHLLILGEGSERAVLQRLVDQLHLSEHVQLMGYDPNPWKWMARSALFVLSSRSEGMPNSVIEAHVLGLPTVMTEYDYSANEFCGDGTILVPTESPAQLANAMANSLSTSRVTAITPPLARDTWRDYLQLLCGKSGGTEVNRPESISG